MFCRHIRNAAVLASLLLGAPCFAAEPEDSAIRIDWGMVSHSRIGSQIETTFDVSLTNAGETEIYGASLRAETLGGTPVAALAPPNSILPDEVIFGDIAPRETVVVENVWLSLDFAIEEPSLVWSLEYIDADGVLRIEQIEQ